MSRPAPRPGWPQVAHACRAGLLAVAVALAGTRDTAARETPASALARLEREWAGHLLAERPHEATRLGLHTRDGALVPVTEDWLARERAWLEGFESRLRAVADAPLSPTRAAARDSLTARVGRVRGEHERRVWELEPARYADLAGDAILDVAARGSACGGAQRAARRLRTVPEILRAARVLMREPARADVEEGVRRFEGVLQLYRVELPARTARCHDGYVQAALAEADTAAVRAAVRFLESLRERLAEPGSR